MMTREGGGGEAELPVPFSSVVDYSRRQVRGTHSRPLVRTTAPTLSSSPEHRFSSPRLIGAAEMKLFAAGLLVLVVFAATLAAPHPVSTATTGFIAHVPGFKWKLVCVYWAFLMGATAQIGY